MATYSGECFCGAVQLQVSGEPEAMGYCHCRSCRSWSGGPVNAFTLWKPEAVKITAGAEHVGMFSKDAGESAVVLQEVRGPFNDQSPAAGIGGRICDDTARAKLQPGRPRELAETVLPMRDNLPKF